MVPSTQGRTYAVVVNDRQQYSLLPTDHAVPDGWARTPAEGTEEHCLAAIAESWRNIRPEHVGDPLPDTLPPLGTNVTMAAINGGLIGLFEARVRQAPEREAVITDGTVWTYEELNARATSIARALDVRSGSVVGIDLPNGSWLLASILGVLKARAAYLPLDASGPIRRNTFMLEDARAAALITSAERAQEYADVPVPILVASAADAPAARRSPGGEPDPDRLVYIHYTSGSTGRPKGVAMSQLPLLNLISWELDRQRLRASLRGGASRRRVLHFMRATFDVSFEEIFGTLLAGDCLVTADEQRRADPAYLIELLNRHQVEGAYLPPMVLAQLAHMSLEAGVPRALWDIVVSGGPLRLGAETRRFLSGLDHPVIDDQYGMTEAHQVLGHILHGDPATWPDTVAFADVLPNTRIHLLDGLREIAGEGVGEICVGGIPVSRGYVGRPGMTAQRFVPDLFGPAPGGRLYRTGDFGRRLPGGAIEVIGRRDDQINLRGHRIELGEVESALQAVPGVASAAVVVVGQDELQRLVAYVVPERHGVRVFEEGLRRELGLRLPQHMIPSTFVLRPALPLNAHGKTDRQALSAWQSEDLPAAEMTPVEAAIAEMWSELMKVQVRSPKEDFFACGGNSVLATQLIARMCRRFGKEIPFSAIMDYPMLADLAAYVDRASAAELPELTPVPNTELVEASYAQQRLWFTCRLFPETTAYNVATTYAVRGQLDEQRLRDALERVARSQESLRTCFVEVDGIPHIKVLDAPPGDLLTCDVVDEADLAEALEDYRRMPFDLDRGPLYRAVLLRTSGDAGALLLCGHHVILDGWSEDLLRREISVAYDGRITQTPPRIQYRDFAAWQRACVEGGAFERQARYWRRRLSGAPEELIVSGHRAREEAVAQAGAVLDFAVDADTVAAIRRIAARVGATPFVVVLTAYAIALARVFEVSEAVIGVPAYGRPVPEVDGLVGYFANSLPLRIDVSAPTEFGRVLRAARGELVGAMANQHLPFDRIVEAVRPPRLAGRNPIFQVWFDFLEENHVLELGQAQVTRMELPGTAEPLDLSLRVHRDGADLRGRLSYNGAIVDRSRSAAIVERFTGELSRLATAGTWRESA